MAGTYFQSNEKPETGWVRFRLMFAIALLVISVGTWYFLSGESMGLRNDDIGVIVLSAKGLFPMAEEVALGWQSDAYLLDVHLKFFAEDEPEVLRATYSFRSLEHEERWLNVYVRSRGSDIDIDSDEGMFLMSRAVGPAIELEKVLDSREALEIIQKSGGNAFFLENAGLNWPQDLYLEHQDRTNFIGALVWRGSYMNPVTHDRLSIVIDAKTGDLLHIDVFED